MHWKKCAAEHEYEDEAWLEPGLALLRKKVRESWTEKHRPGRSFWMEVARKKGSSILDGRISVSVKLARWRKAQKSTGFTTVQNGTQ